MASVPTGTTFYIATAYGAVQSTTIVTNATEAVVTCTAHGYLAGDIVEMTSAWGRLNNRIFKVKSPAANTFVLEGMDTSSTAIYPAGNGIGSVRKVSTFTQIVQVMSASSSGGDPKNVDYKYIESDVSYSINDGFSATSYSMTLDADSNTTAGYLALKALTEVQTNTCLKMLSRSGAVIYQPCTAALNESVKLADGQVNQVSASFNGNNRLTRY